MRALNYTEIRAMVKSNQITIDINPHVFNHPYYINNSISDIDYKIKQQAFNNLFMIISDYSYNSKFSEKLVKETNIRTYVLLPPKNEYINLREKTGLGLYISRLKNYINHIKQLKIRPYQIVTLPITINIIEGFSIPDIKFNLNEEYSRLGLKVININTSLYSETDDTYITVINSSNKNIVIDDLSYIGNIRFII